MKLSDKDKKLLVLLLLTGVLALTYFYVYSPFVKKINDMKTEVQKLQNNYNTLQGKSAQKNRMESEMKFIRFEMEQFNKRLPADILQENVIRTIKQFSEDSKVELSDLSFSDVSAVTGKVEPKKTDPTLQEKLLEEMLPNTENEKNEKKTDGESTIPDNTGIVMEIKARYSADYEQMKYFLASVMNWEQEIMISDITFSKDLKGTISGNLKLSFYGFKDRSKEVPEWKSDVERGKDNIFDPFEGYVEEQLNSGELISDLIKQEYKNNDAVNTQKNDFYISLGPSNYDVPTVIMYKTGRSNTTVYGDGNAMEKLEFRLDYKDGKYSFRYGTSYQNYPKDINTVEEFLPENSDIIVLEIFAKDRLDSQDLSGASIDIYNNTPAKLVIKHRDDNQRPRAKISIKKGDVVIQNE